MQAVLDADFINKIDEIKSTDTKQLFRKLMKELNCTPVVHPYVMSHEQFSCNLAQDMIEEGLLRSVDYKEFLPDDKREGYEQRFRDLYWDMTFEESGQGIEAHDNIFIRHAGCSYGEVHSVLMAAELGIPVFYSNDHSGKTLCNHFRNLESKTIHEICEEYKGKDGSIITAKEWKYLCHST